MSLQDKIKKLINVINDTNINEIEVTSFWGAQKIRLSKSVKNTNINHQSAANVKEVIVEEKSETTPTIHEHRNEESQKEAISEETVANKIYEEEKTLEKEYSEEDLSFQKAPLVGTFYSSSKPGEPTFVKEGDEVVKGQILCIIEAMKIFNEIESDFEGTIVEVLVDDKSPVEFNQPIFSIKEK